MSKRAVMPLTDYENACEKIREKTGTADLIKSGDLSKKIDDVFEKGKQSNYDFLWDTLQDNGNRKSYNNTFSAQSLSWTDELYNPKYPIFCGGSSTSTANQTFYNCSLTDTKVPIIIEDTRFDNTFGFCIYLKRIQSLTLNNLERISNPFQNCRELEELNIYGEINVSGLNVSASTKLTHDSLMSVIRALKDFSTTVVDNAVVTVNQQSNYFISSGNIVVDKEYSVEIVIASTGVTYKGIYKPVFSEAYQRYELYFFTPYPETKPPIAYDRIYNDGENLMLSVGYNFNSDVNITIKELPDETHTVTFGATNLAKLTDAEKVQATEKGWTLL